MNILVSESERKKVIRKINTFFDFEQYCDYEFLDSDLFMKKYGFIGFSFSNWYSIRFHNEPNIYVEICNFLVEDNYYLITISKEEKSIFKITKNDISTFLIENNIRDFIILETKMTWLLVYDNHRKMTGFGNYIKKKIKRNINLKFGAIKLMFTNNDI